MMKEIDSVQVEKKKPKPSSILSDTCNPAAQVGVVLTSPPSDASSHDLDAKQRHLQAWSRFAPTAQAAN